MATVVSFNGRRIIEPGVYSQIKSGIPARPSTFSFGNLMIIDTGSGAGFGGGSGISGQFATGLNSVYSFDDVDDFKDFVKGGLIWDLADYIFNPLNGASGPEKVYIARAAETTPAEIEYEFNSDPARGGKVKFLLQNEGSTGNGQMDEIRAKATIKVDPATIVVGDNFEISVEGAVIAASTMTTTSRLVEMAAMAEVINTGATGYTAEVKNNDLILCSPINTGSDPNTFSVTLTGDVAFVAGQTSVQLLGGEFGTILTQGYAAIMVRDENDNNKFKLEFYQGTYNGQSDNGADLGGIPKSQTKPFFITETPSFDNIDNLIQWAKNDFVFNKVFKLDEDYIINGNGAIVNDDLVANSDMVLATGGTEDYTPAALDKTLEDIKELDNTFFLCDRFGEEARGVQNNKIFQHILNDAEFDKFMIVAAGDDESSFKDSPNSSIEVAKFYDNTAVITVHGGNEREIGISGAFERLSSIYHAANFAGRLGGLESQEPVTFKALRISNFTHILGQSDRELALQAGVIHNRFVPGIGNVVNQGINSIQRNTQLINTDGTSFEISIMRIGAQLNKELTLNMRPLFIGKNRGTVTAADVKSFVEGYLLSRTATTNVDNLIISFKNVTVRLIEDYYDVKYGFVPNGPINKLFITGFMLDTNLSA